MKKELRFALLLALLLTLIMLCACGRETEPAPASPAPTDSPAAPAPTPHVHEYDPATGLCRGCGEACLHEGGFGQDGVCPVCGWACPHEEHDPETAGCLACGAPCRHHFGMAGRCACGREAPLALVSVPEGRPEPSEHEGTCLVETLTDPEGRTHRIAVWLPWDYDGVTPCNLVLLIPGDGGSCEDWTDREHRTSLGTIQMCRVYDYLTERRLCEPFIVVGLDKTGLEDPAWGERLIEETVLPHLARSYTTYMEGDSPEQIAAAREHIAIGGLSRGSMYAYSVGMDRCFDVAANFCCFSNGYQPSLIKRLESGAYAELPMRAYVATVGLRDEPDYIRGHRRHYELLVDGVERLTDGENARFLEIEGGHDYLTWSLSIYNALLLMF